MSCKIISRRQRLSRVEADRITRLLRALSQGIDVFGNGELAAKWLLSSLPELSNLRPIDVLYSKAGYERVRDLLDRITFGLGV
ncbi:antitoxin Xre/MbcA/ParS toxin-binding domain-containing protein [Trinickia dabaoshanensis]